MSIQEKLRKTIASEHQQIKNRQQSILMRASQALGLHQERAHYWNPVQGKLDFTTQMLYGRSQATMS